MKKKIYALLIIASNFVVFAQMEALTENEVRTFIMKSATSQVGTEAAVEAYYNSLSDQLVYWFNPVWKNKPVAYIKPKSKDGTKFYEDSITVEIHDILLMGAYANVMGTMKWYIAGANTTYRNFSCVLTKEDQQVRYIRFMGAENTEVASRFLWPSTANKSNETAYFDMREELLNLNIDRALKMSDSLVVLEPNLALAHLGQLFYYQMTNNQAKLNECHQMALSKLDNASPAEKHVILSINTRDENVSRYHLEQALIYAGDDQYIRVALAYGEKDPKKAIQILQPSWDHFPENGAVNNMLGYKYMEDGQMDKAKTHFEIYLRVYPTTPNAYDSIGDYYVQAGDKTKAKAMYMKAYELDNSWEKSKKKADKL